MAARNGSAGVRELLWPFGRFHVLGVALIGCLALAVLTDTPFWRWAGLGGAVLGTIWGVVMLYREGDRA